MSRAGAGEPIQVRPQNNVYTAIAAAAVVVQIVALVIIIMKAGAVGGLLPQ
jgi:hypothetical protein